MNTKFYIYASGAEKNIQKLSEEISWPGAVIKALSPKKLKERQWMWRTPYELCSSDYPEDQLVEYFRSNEVAVSQLSGHRSTLQELVVMLVCELGAGEIPHGYSISPELMSKLLEINASLEIDIVAQLKA